MIPDIWPDSPFHLLSVQEMFDFALSLNANVRRNRSRLEAELMRPPQSGGRIMCVMLRQLADCGVFFGPCGM